MIKKFLQAIEKQDVVHQMLLDLVELKKRDKWNQHHHIQLETIDQNFTKLLLTAEKQCAIPIEYPWSPQLDQKAKKNRYWTLQLQKHKNNINLKAQLDFIENQIPQQKFYHN
jgi:hypothetical protein